jgi:hypothetical protein
MPRPMGLNMLEFDPRFPQQKSLISRPADDDFQSVVRYEDGRRSDVRAVLQKRNVLGDGAPGVWMYSDGDRACHVRTSPIVI